jgi:hypothetical protein
MNDNVIEERNYPRNYPSFFNKKYHYSRHCIAAYLRTNYK